MLSTVHQMHELSGQHPPNYFICSEISDNEHLFSTNSGIQVIHSQLLTPDDDKVYLDTLQAEIDSDLGEAKNDLVREAKAVRTATEKYATAKLTHNIFRALRVLALKELDQVPVQYRMRQPRQEEAEESSAAGGSDGDNEEVAEGSSGSSSSGGASTTARTVPLIPVLAGILKSVFGGGENATTTPLNVTHAFQHLFFPLGNPFKGVSSLLRPRRPTPAPATIIKYYPVPVYPTAPPTTPLPVTEAPPTVPTTTRILRLVGRRQGRVNGRVMRSAQVSRALEPLRTDKVPPQPKNLLYPNMDSIYAPSYPALPIRQPNPAASPSATTSAPPMLIYAPNHMIHKGYAPSHPLQPAGPAKVTQVTLPEFTTPAPTTPKPKPTYLPVFAEASARKTTTARTDDGEAASTGGAPETDAASTSSPITKTPVTLYPTTTEAPKPGLIYVDSLARDVQNSFDGLVKNLPDILKGAKDAIALLGNLREIFAEEESDG